MKPYKQTTNDGSDTLYSLHHQQTFHSVHGALTESEHVFLKGSTVMARLAQKRPTRVLEVGFGTGLNFWLTAHYSCQAASQLHYVALEIDLLPSSLLATLNHAQQLGLEARLLNKFLTWRETLTDVLLPGRFLWTGNERITLELILGDATLVSIPNYRYHAIYQDAFSPDASPELWTEAFFTRLYEVLTPGGKLSTYSVKGTVRWALQVAGFQVQKQPGPPGKREMLVATRPV